MSGSTRMRAVADTPSGRSAPDWTCGIAEAMASNIACTSPAMSSRVRRRRASIGHVHRLDAGHHPEQFAGEMAQVSGAARARLILPGLALAWAMNSETVLTGNDGLTIRTKESLLMLATGTMSRVTVNGAFS